MTRDFAAQARKASTPWRSKSIKGDPSANAKAQRKARKELSEAEIMTGLSAEELRAEQLRLRAAMLERSGRAAA